MEHQGADDGVEAGVNGGTDVRLKEIEVDDIALLDNSCQAAGGCLDRCVAGGDYIVRQWERSGDQRGRW